MLNDFHDFIKYPFNIQTTKATWKQSDWCKSHRQSTRPSSSHPFHTAAMLPWKFSAGTDMGCDGELSHLHTAFVTVFGLFILEKRRLRKDLNVAFQYMRRAYEQEVE